MAQLAYVGRKGAVSSATSLKKPLGMGKVPCLCQVAVGLRLSFACRESSGAFKHSHWHICVRALWTGKLKPIPDTGSKSSNPKSRAKGKNWFTGPLGGFCFIPRELRPNIFQPFIKSSGRYPATTSETQRPSCCLRARKEIGAPHGYWRRGRTHGQ